MLSNHGGFPRSVLKPGLAGLIAVFLFTFSPPGRGAAVVLIRGGIGAAYVAPAPAINVTFRFEVVDLADTTPGQDLWEYSYQVSGLTLTAGQASRSSSTSISTNCCKARRHSSTRISICSSRSRTSR